VSVVVWVRVCAPGSSRTPVSAGIPGLVDTPRWTVWSASEKSSRSHLNFTLHLLPLRLSRYFFNQCCRGMGKPWTTIHGASVAATYDTDEIRWTNGRNGRCRVRRPH